MLLEQQVEAINRFPDQNPNPVMRITRDGYLLYANISSKPIRLEWGVEVGELLPKRVLKKIWLKCFDSAAPAIEITHEHRTFSVLPVYVEDLDFVNLYGTDITGEKVVERFPGQNPNPVLRVTPAGELIYHNDASALLVEALGLRDGRPIPEQLKVDIHARLDDPTLGPIEQPAADHVYELKPVLIAEFGFVNLYGTDVTAARQLAEAHELNQRLLLNILPGPIAQRLLAGERVIADSFDEVTLLFADIVDFTVMSSRLSAREVVDLLNEVFNATDRLVDQFGLEKIKTIGDAYMVVGGLPEPSDDHAERVADMALALSDELARMRTAAGETLSARMGIHVGPAVAGVIGSKKFIYDVWGDTVNTASRMESHGLPDRIQVTAPVFRRLAGRYRFEPRGEIEVKGKGPMETWFLLGRS